MVNIKVLEIKIAKPFKINTKKHGEIEFQYPTLKHHKYFSAFANSRKDSKDAFIDLLHALILQPKLSKSDLGNLPDYRLRKIGTILLNSHALQGKYEKIKSKSKYGNFYDKLRRVFKDYINNLLKPSLLEETLKSFTFPELERFQQLIKQVELARGVESTIEIMQRLSTLDALSERFSAHGDTLEFLNNTLAASPILENYYRNDFFSEAQTLLSTQRDFFGSMAGITKSFQDALNPFGGQIADVLHNFDQLGTTAQLFTELDSNQQLLESIVNAQKILPSWIDDLSTYYEDALEIEEIRKQLGPRKISWLRRVLKKLQAWSSKIKDASLESYQENKKLIIKIISVFRWLASRTPQILGFFEGYDLLVSRDPGEFAKLLEVLMDVIDQLL